MGIIGGTAHGTEPSPAEVDRAGPRLQRIVLGARLRKLRDDRGLSRRDAAEAIRASESKISRLELGRTGFKPRDVADLLDLYEVSDEERGTLLALATMARQPPWWQAYRDVVPDWRDPFLSLEQDAQVIRSYEPSRVPALLQTADYARAVLRLNHPDAPAAEINHRISLRLHRQELLWKREPQPPTLWTVLDETVLRRPAGGWAVMQAQLEALIEAAGQPHIRIWVVPFSAGQAGAVGVPFTILRFPDDLSPDVVFLRCPTQAVYPEKPDEIQFYWHLMNTLATEARPPRHTVRILEQILREG